MSMTRRELPMNRHPYTESAHWNVKHQAEYEAQLNRDTALMLIQARNDQADLENLALNRKCLGWFLGFVAGCVVTFLAVHAFWRVVL